MKIPAVTWNSKYLDTIIPMAAIGGLATATLLLTGNYRVVLGGIAVVTSLVAKDQFQKMETDREIKELRSQVVVLSRQMSTALEEMQKVLTNQMVILPPVGPQMENMKNRMSEYLSYVGPEIENMKNRMSEYLPSVGPQIENMNSRMSKFVDQMTSFCAASKDPISPYSTGSC